MSTVAASSQQGSPTDNELLDLYNEVWDVYVNDSPTSRYSSSNDNASPANTSASAGYHQYSNITNNNLNHNQFNVDPGRSTTTSASSPSSPPIPFPVPHPPPPPPPPPAQSQNSPIRTKTLPRPLPRTPGPSSSKSHSPVPISMPDPQYYQTAPLPPPPLPPPPPQNPSPVSSSRPTPQVNTNNAASSRRLPIAPNGSINGMQVSYSPKNPSVLDANLPRLNPKASFASLATTASSNTTTGGGQSKMTLTHKASSSLSNANISRPPTSNGFYASSNTNTNEEWAGDTSSSNSSTLTYRPKGALPPVTPGMAPSYTNTDSDSYLGQRISLDNNPNTPSILPNLVDRGSTNTPPPPPPPPRHPYRSVSPATPAQYASVNGGHRPPVRTASRPELRAFATGNGISEEFMGSSAVRAGPSGRMPDGIGATSINRTTSAQSTQSAQSSTSYQSSRTQQSLYSTNDTILFNQPNSSSPSTPATTVERGKSLSSVVSGISATSTVSNNTTSSAFSEESSPSPSNSSLISAARPQDSVIDIYRQPSIVVSDSGTGLEDLGYGIYSNYIDGYGGNTPGLNQSQARAQGHGHGAGGHGHSSSFSYPEAESSNTATLRSNSYTGPGLNTFNALSASNNVNASNSGTIIQQQQPLPVPVQPRRRRQTSLERTLETLKRPLDPSSSAYGDSYDDPYYDGEDYYDGEEYDEYDEEDESRFVNLALLSHLAVGLKDKVPRGTHVKGGIPYGRAFTGKDIVSTIQSMIQRPLHHNLGLPSSDRRASLQIARSLQNQLFFYEVEWGGRTLQDGVEDVYMFLDDQEGGPGVSSGDSPFLEDAEGSTSRGAGAGYEAEREGLPTGVFTLLTKCYAPLCQEGRACYSYGCPRRKREVPELNRTMSVISTSEDVRENEQREWVDMIDAEVLKSLPESEINRQTIIHKAISKEQLYVQDLDIIESLFIKPLRTASPSIIPPNEMDKFIDDVFSNILDVRECNRRLLEVLAVRQREQSPIIQKIGDVFLSAAAEFRSVYPVYVGNLPLAEKRVKEEMERNTGFKLWLDECLRHPDSRRLDLKHFLTRPSEHLQKYVVTLEAVRKETTEGNPDAEFLLEAVQAIEKLSSVAQLRTFQSAMGRGPTGKLEWHDMVSQDVRLGMPKKEAKRQSIIFELIKGEMAYVKDLELMEPIFIRPLKNANPPIILHDRLNLFLQDVFHNYSELLGHHRKLLQQLHEIQREEHPVIRSITAPMLDAALNWRDAYMKYVPNYPIGWYRIDDECAKNPAFKTFFDQCVRHPEAHKYDMKTFIHRPIARLLRYDLLLSSIMNEAPPNHEDRDSIPQVLEVLRALGKETDSATEASKEKVEIWRYNENLVFKQGESIDMDLLHESRSLVHTGKLWRQPETGFEWNGWTELYVILFDNYLVLTKPKEKDGVTKYHVNRRPIPLDLLTLVNFTDPPQQRGKGLLGGFSRSNDKPVNDSASIIGGGTDDSRYLYPCTIHHNGRLGGLWTLYADSSQGRTEWKKKLDEAVLLRKVVTDANKVFEVETLSSETFLVPSMHANVSGPSWNGDSTITGKVTCSVPFSTADGRGLVAVGCAEGVWIGLRHDPKSMRRVLHLKMVTQCAMLQEFGIFLVLADKSLFAYHIEALVPSTPPNSNVSRTPQKLNGNKDVQFFSVGTLNGRTLVIYMKKKSIDSIFRVLEPVAENITERTRAPGGFSRFTFGSQRSEWFRVYRDFFLPSDSHDLIFLKAKIAIMCTKGFEIMELADFRSQTIPQREDPRLQSLAKRCETCKPIGMFRSNEDEFLLCYDEFGLHVNRHGEPSRSSGTIEWEGTAERAAYHPPYVLLFDTRFIEIRHVETGRLVQIIPGNDIRCIWDGRGSGLPPIQTPGPNGWSDTPTPEARVHAVMKATDSSTSTAKSRAVAQHVFQLTPTIPLYLPESSSLTSSTSYFTQNASPSNSPTMTPRHSWR